jgi:hypothetical protein
MSDLLTGWRELSNQELRDMGMRDSDIARSSGCSKLYINTRLTGPKDAVGMDIRLATGHLVRDTCRRTREEQVSLRKDCVTRQQLYLADVRGIYANTELTEEARQKLLAAATASRAPCTIDPVFDGKTSMCNVYESSGIHLAECDCTHATQIPSIQYALAERCKEAVAEADTQSSLPGDAVTSKDCENLEMGKGLPDNYKTLRDVRLQNLIARYTTRAITDTSLGQGNYLYCNYPGCSVENPSIHVNALEAGRVKPDCKVPMCVINIQQKWSPESSMRIVGNHITLNCNKDGGDCGGNGAKQPDGSCVCNPGYAGDQCSIRRSGPSTPSSPSSPSPSSLPASTSTSTDAISWLGSYWPYLAAGLVALILISVLVSKISSAEGKRDTQRQKKMLVELKKMDKQLKVVEDREKN